jgi:hypothetical protein
MGRLKPIPRTTRAQARIVNKVEGLYTGLTAEDIETAIKIMDALAAAYKIAGYKSLYAARNKRVDRMVRRVKRASK